MINAPQKWVPLPYMKRAVRFLLSHGGGGLFLSPGLRKTSITLAAIKILKSEGIGPFLIIAPKRVCQLVWPKEQLKWLDFNSLKMEVLLGTPKKRAEALERKADVYVINYEGLDWLFSYLGSSAWGNRRWPFDGVVCDESTKLKSTSSARFRLLRHYLGKFKRRWILTGTPAPNGLLDLFGQVFIMDMGAALGKYITHYRMEYFDKGGYGGYTWTLKADDKGITTATEKRIYERLAPLVLRLDSKDYLDLPPLHGVNPQLLIEVELPPTVRKQYDQLEDILMTQIEDGLVKAANAGVASMKLRQICNGGIYTSADLKTWSNLHDEKTNAVEELLEGLSGNPLLVAIDFRHDVDRLKKKFRDKLRVIDGTTSDKEAAWIERAWNQGEIQLLAANPASVAHGLNLQAGPCKDIAWHSQTWNHEYYVQFIQRVYRSGVKSSVTVHHIVAIDTVDSALLAAQRSKAKTQGALLDALKAYAEARRK